MNIFKKLNRNFLFPVMTVFMLCTSFPIHLVGQTKSKKFSILNFYNLKGNIQSHSDSIFSIDDSGEKNFSSLKITEYKYGDLFKEILRSKSGEEKIVTYTSHENGFIETIVTQKRGKIINKKRVQLDSKGFMTTAQSYDSAGNMDYYNTDFKMDEIGNLLGGKLFTADGVLVRSFSSEYQNYSQVKNISKDTGGKEKITSFELNRYGDPIVQKITSIKSDSVETNIKTYRYEYDQYGNWTFQKVLNETGKTTMLIKRTITYSTNFE